MVARKYRAFLTGARKKVEYWRQLAVRDFTEDLLLRMQARGIKQVALAAKMEVRPAYVSRVLRGSDNLTLATMVKMAMAVGGKLRLHIADRDAETRFVDEITATHTSAVDMGCVDPAVAATFRVTFSGQALEKQTNGLLV